MSKNQGITIFFTWFFIGIIVFGFIATMIAVDFIATENGFSGFIKTQKAELGIDDLSASVLTFALEKTKTAYSAAEQWVDGEGMRLFKKTWLLVDKAIKYFKREKQEQEFYKNAGLV